MDVLNTWTLWINLPSVCSTFPLLYEPVGLFWLDLPLDLIHWGSVFPPHSESRSKTFLQAARKETSRVAQSAKGRVTNSSMRKLALKSERRTCFYLPRSKRQTRHQPDNLSEAKCFDMREHDTSQVHLVKSSKSTSLQCTSRSRRVAAAPSYYNFECFAAIAALILFVLITRRRVHVSTTQLNYIRPVS